MILASITMLPGEMLSWMVAPTGNARKLARLAVKASALNVEMSCSREKTARSS